MSSDGDDGPVTIRRMDVGRVGIASLVAAGSGYVVLAVTARALTVAENTVFVTFWSTLFAIFGVLSGISLETTRSAASRTTDEAGQHERRHPDVHPRLLVVGVAVGVALAAALSATAGWWAPRLFSRDAAVLGVLVAVGAAGFSVHSVVVGALAGERRWRPYALLVGGESVVRLLAALAVAVVASAPLGYAAASALATFTWVGLLALSPAAREAARARADSTTPVLLRRLAAASVATGASALLVVGFPVLLSLTTPAPEYALAAPVLLAITLTRAPLMIPLNAYQGVAVAHFVGHRERGLRALAPIARWVLGLGAAGALLAALAGPWLMRVLLGPDYHVAGTTLAALTLGATGLAVLTLTGALCQALALHRWFVTGWLVALGVAVAVLLLPGSLVVRATAALLAGPVAGAVVHLAVLRRLPARTISPLPTRPVVSVCMATYRGQDHVLEQIRSILDQLGPQDELVIVDDASPDATVEVIRALGDPRVRLTVAEHNRGYVVSFADAMGRARGDVLLLADQDDVWEPGRVEAMTAALDTAEVVATNLSTLDGPGTIPGPYGQPDWHLRAEHSTRRVRNILGVLAGNRPYYGSAMGLRRTALVTVLPFPDFLVESHDLWVALYGNAAGSIVHLPIRSVRRRFHDANTSPDRPRALPAVLRSRWMLLRCLVELRRRLR